MQLRAMVLSAVLTAIAGPALAEAVMEMDPRLPDHTVYRPADLAKAKGKLPVVVWGNGACLNVGSAYAPLLKGVAARGYLVLAPGPIVETPPPRQPGAPMAQGKTEQLYQSIDFALAENARAGSPYRGRIDTRHIAVMGHSCGGLQAIAVGADPRITTVAVLNSGIIRGAIRNPDGTTRQPAGYLPAGESDLAKLHTPMLYLNGGVKDQAQPGALGDYEAIQTLPVFYAELPVGHGGTWREPAGGAMGAVVLDWLDWKLKGDAKAAKTFTGADCGLCRDAKWTVKRKNMN